MCLNCSVEGVGYGRQESCVQEKLFNRVPSVLGEFGKVSVVILPGTMALLLLEHKGPGRGSERLPGGACRTRFPWLEHGRVRRSRRGLCVCTAQWGLAAGAQVCCVPAAEWALEHTGSCALALCKATLCESAVVQGELPPFSLLVRKNSQKIFLHFLGTTEKLDLIAVLHAHGFWKAQQDIKPPVTSSDFCQNFKAFPFMQ